MQSWIELADLLAADLSRQIVFLVGPAEQQLTEVLSCHIARKPNMHIRSFSDIRRLSGFLKAARAYVGPSTGITHLASALGVPGLALYPEARSMHPTRWMPFSSSLHVYSLEKNPSPADVALALSGIYKPCLLYTSPSPRDS